MIPYERPHGTFPTHVAAAYFSLASPDYRAGELPPKPASSRSQLPPPMYGYMPPGPEPPMEPYPPYAPMPPPGSMQPPSPPSHARGYAKRRPPVRAATPPMRYAPEPADPGMEFHPMYHGGGRDMMRPPPLHDDRVRHGGMPAMDMGMCMPPQMPPPMQEASASKRDRKRREILERLDRTHWEGLENRDALYHDAYMAMTSTYHALLVQPALVREYAIALADKTLQRNATLREIALFHAYRMERSQHSYAVESTKAEDEARVSKRNVRDKLLSVIEDRRRRLKDERDGGEFAADFLLQSQRQHTTRQLRYKGGMPGTPPSLSQLARHGSVFAASGTDDDVSPPGNATNIVSAVAQLLGWSELDAAAAIASAADNEQGDSDVSPPRTLLCTTPDGTKMQVPMLDAFGSPTSLLTGVNMSMAAASAAAAALSKSKKKGSSATSKLVGVQATAPLGDRTAPDTEDDMASASAASATPLLSSGGGRLRWDTAKCLSQLTGAKDYEVESDLINIHKIGLKRRRR
ncbi:hypothetical protein MSPP1_000963 [Malassezia sp. CBS 17886]|nr:hypothetical protein MSPP1_000963 [Malassezia sp. CBS 17886]